VEDGDSLEEGLGLRVPEAVIEKEGVDVIDG
jgi:hypothetical protein